MEPVEHRLHSLLLTLDMRFDAAVRTVADPPGDAQFARSVAGRLAEEHALHTTGHSDMAGDQINSPEPSRELDP